MTDFFIHGLGTVGSALIILCYGLCQFGKIDLQSNTANWINLVGAVLLIISLAYNFNLGSFIIEIFWIGIATYGIWRNSKFGFGRDPEA